MKKLNSLEFMYSNKKEKIDTLEIEEFEAKDKDKIINETVKKLITEHKAINIVVKETCVYKIL